MFIVTWIVKKIEICKFFLNLFFNGFLLFEFEFVKKIRKRRFESTKQVQTDFEKSKSPTTENLENAKLEKQSEIKNEIPLDSHVKPEIEMKREPVQPLSPKA